MQLFLPFFSFLFISFISTSSICNDYSSDDNTCSSCAYQNYSLTFISSPFSRIPSSSCLPRSLSQLYNQTIFIQPGSSCGLSCDGTETNPYPELFAAFLDQSKKASPYALDSEINFLLVGGPHYLLRKHLLTGYFGFFRKQRLKITIRPALCSETQLIDCFNDPTQKAIVYVKTDEAFIFNSGTLLVQNVIFNASDLHMQIGNDPSADYNQEIAGCDFLKIMDSSNQCYISGTTINRIDENSWLYPYGLFTNELIFDYHLSQPNASYPNLTIDNCEFHYFHSIKSGFGFISLIKLAPHPNNLFLINTKFKGGFLFNGILSNRPSFDFSSFPTNMVTSNVSLISCIIKDYNAIKKQQSFQTTNGIFTFLNFNRNFLMQYTQIANITLMSVNYLVAYNPVIVGHFAFFYEDINTKNLIGNVTRVYLIDNSLMQNLTILSVFRMANVEVSVDTINIQNSLINIGNFQYFLYLKSYNLLYNNNTFQYTAFNHALRFDLNLDYNPFVIISNSTFNYSTGWFIDNNAFPYNSLLSYNNLTAQTPYHATYWELSNSFFMSMYGMALVEGRKSFCDTFVFSNNTITNYSRVNLQWSLIGIGPFQSLRMINNIITDTFVWEVINVRWSPVYTLLANLTFTNTVIQALFHIRIIYTPNQYFVMKFANISLARLTNLPNNSNVNTNMLVDHAQPGLPSSPDYVPTLILSNCSFHITVVSASFLQMYKFLFPVHLKIENCLFDYHGPMVLTQSLFTYVALFKTRLTINNTFIYNDAYTNGSLNSQGLAVIGYVINFVNSSFIQSKSQDFLYSMLSSNIQFQVINCYFQNWVFNVDGLSQNLLISASLFNLTVLSPKLNSQHLQLSNKDGVNANYSQIIEDTIFLGQPIQGGLLLKQGGSLTIRKITIMNPATQRPSQQLGSVILAQSGSVLQIRGSNFINCWASLSMKGGCIYSEIQTQVDINGTLFQVATSYYGGFLFAMNSFVSISSSVFQEGLAQKGAGIFVVGGTIRVTDCSFLNNAANKSGGHLYFDQTAASLTTTSFSFGEASLSGAVLDAYNLISLIIDTCVITNNTSNGLSVLLIKNSNSIPNVNIINSIFISNTANQYGCLLIRYANFQMINSSFFDNQIGLFHALINFQGKSDNFIVCNVLFATLLLQNNFGPYLIDLNSVVATLNNITFDSNLNSQDLIQMNTGIYTITNFSIVHSPIIDLNQSLFILNAKFVNSIFINNALINGEAQKAGLVCESCDTLSITNTIFTNCFIAYQGAAIYLLTCKKTTLKSSSFINNSATVNNAGIYMEESPLYIDSCLFQNNSLQNKANAWGSTAVDILSYSTSDLTGILQLFNCYFNASSGFSQILFQQHTNFEADSCFFSNGFKTNSIYCSDCSKINIINSSFIGFDSKGCLFLKNSLYNPIILMIFGCSFQNNTNSIDGGAMISKGNLQGQIGNSSFHNNVALGGFGGALHYDCESVDYSCDLLVSNSNFTNNSASLDGGAIKISGKLLTQHNNLFKKNLARNGFGNDIASIPRKLQIIYQETSFLQNYTSGDLMNCLVNENASNLCPNLKKALISVDNQSLNDILSLRSGYAFVVLVSFLDDFLQLVPPTEKEFLLLVAKNSPNAAKVEANLGVNIDLAILFHELIIIGTIDSDITLTFQNNGVSYTFGATFNSCYTGDIILNQRCITCSPGFYSFSNNDTKCLICDINARCLGGASLVPNPGYWRNDYSTNILQCPIKEACPNENNTINCREGSSGRTCSICEEGFGLTSDGECRNCKSSSSYYLKMIISSLYVFLLISFEFIWTIDERKKKRLVNIIKIGINHTQLIMILANINLSWQTKIKNFFDYQIQISPLPPDSFSWDCVMLSTMDDYSKFTRRLWMQTFAPLFYCAVMILALFIQKYWRKSRPENDIIKSNNNDDPVIENDSLKNQTNMPRDILLIMVIVSYNFYVILLLQSFSIFNCLSFEENNVTKYFLAQYPQMECFQPDHYKLILSFFIPTAVFWILGIPFFLTSQMKTNLLNEKGKDKFLVNSTSFLTSAFRPRYKLWEAIGLFRKFILALFSQLLVLKDKLLAGNTFVLILAIFFFAFEWMRPYYSGTGLNLLESTSYMTILIIVHLILASSNDQLSSYFDLFYGLMILMMLVFYLMWILLFLQELAIVYGEKYEIFRVLNNLLNVRRNKIEPKQKPTEMKVKEIDLKQKKFKVSENKKEGK